MILFTPPSFALILRQRLETVAGLAFLTTVSAITHWVFTPTKLLPTLFTSSIDKKQVTTLLGVIYNVSTYCRRYHSLFCLEQQLSAEDLGTVYTAY